MATFTDMEYARVIDPNELTRAFEHASETGRPLRFDLIQELLDKTRLNPDQVYRIQQACDRAILEHMHQNDEHQATVWGRVWRHMRNR